MARIYYRCEPFSKADVTLALIFGRVSAKAASWDTVFLTHISISEIWIYKI